MVLFLKTVIAVRPSPTSEVAAALLTDGFGGVMNCDREKIYWRFERLQWCWAHLNCDLQALIDQGIIS